MGERGEEAGRRRLQVATVQPHRRNPGLVGQPCELAEQDGLAHAAWSMDIQEGERRLLLGERRPEQRQLHPAPDNAPTPSHRQPLGESWLASGG